MRGNDTLNPEPLIRNIGFHRLPEGEYIRVSFSDGKILLSPLALYPSLLKATASHRKAFRLISGGRGVHWKHLDLDLSAEGLLAGRPDFTVSSTATSTPSARVLRLLTSNPRPLSVRQIAAAVAEAIPSAKRSDFARVFKATTSTSLRRASSTPRRPLAVESTKRRRR